MGTAFGHSGAHSLCCSRLRRTRERRGRRRRCHDTLAHRGTATDGWNNERRAIETGDVIDDFAPFAVGWAEMGGSMKHGRAEVAFEVRRMQGWEREAEDAVERRSRWTVSAGERWLDGGRRMERREAQHGGRRP